MLETERVRCPCCDSIFEINISRIQILRGKVILDKVNTEKPPKER